MTTRRQREHGSLQRACGTGTGAVSCDGQPLVLDCSPQPTYVDPQAFGSGSSGGDGERPALLGGLFGQSTTGVAQSRRGPERQ